MELGQENEGAWAPGWGEGEQGGALRAAGETGGEEPQAEGLPGPQAAAPPHTQLPSRAHPLGHPTPALSDPCAPAPREDTPRDAPVCDMGTVPFSEWNGWNNDGICLE